MGPNEDVKRPGAAIALALLWTQGVVTLLDTLALQVGGVLETVDDLTPDASAVSLPDMFAASRGGADVEMYFRVDPAVSALVLVCYAVAFFLVGLFLLRHRDVR
jgi:hypothetical protein